MANLKFTPRPNPVLPEHRPLYKIAQLLLILSKSRQKKSSLLRLHLFNWALKSEGGIRLLQQAAQRNALSLLTWGFDPAVSIALRYALAENLVSQISTGYQLEPKGQLFLNQALQHEDAFVVERDVLEKVSNGITEKMVETIAKDWA